MCLLFVVQPTSSPLALTEMRLSYSLRPLYACLIIVEPKSALSVAQPLTMAIAFDGIFKFLEVDLWCQFLRN